MAKAQPMNVLITGAGGFIGCHLVASQLLQGHQVRAADLNIKPLAKWSGHQRLDMVKADITDPASVKQLVEDVDIVYHLASAHLDVTLSDRSYRAVNVEGTANVVEAASAAGVRRFVHCSTVGVFGKLDVPPPAQETSPCRPTHIYESSKLEGERLALDFARKTGYPIVVVRPAWVYGPGCPRTRKLLRTVATGRFVMFGDGRTARHPLYVGDAVRGLERCGQVEKDGGNVYILAGPNSVTIEELVQLVADVQGVKLTLVHLPPIIGHVAGAALQLACRPLQRQPPFSRRSMDFFLKDNLYDTSRAKRELGFQALVTLREGLELTVAHRDGSDPKVDPNRTLRGQRRSA
jgi:nucleoside-diphosphate-sugar epimerase